MARRTCRACGCWELRACEGGCGWLSADRCTACPDAALTLPINEEHVVAATLVEVDRKDTAGVVSVTYQAREFPNLIVTAANAGGHEEVHVYVGAIEVSRTRADQVAQLLNEVREAA